MPPYSSFKMNYSWFDLSTSVWYWPITDRITVETYSPRFTCFQSRMRPIRRQFKVQSWASMWRKQRHSLIKEKLKILWGSLKDISVWLTGWLIDWKSSIDSLSWKKIEKQLDAFYREKYFSYLRIFPTLMWNLFMFHLFVSLPGWHLHADPVGQVRSRDVNPVCRAGRSYRSVVVLWWEFPEAFCFFLPVFYSSLAWNTKPTPEGRQSIPGWTNQHIVRVAIGFLSAWCSCRPGCKVPLIVTIPKGYEINSLTHHPLRERRSVLIWCPESIGWSNPLQSNSECWLPSREAMGTNGIILTVSGLTRPGIKLTTSQSQGKTLPLEVV